MPSTRTKKQAHKILDGIEEVVRNEMLVQGSYATGVLKPELAKEGAICGGRQACLVGSAALAAGVPVLVGNQHSMWGAERSKWINRRAGVKLALSALDDAAETRMLRGTPRAILGRGRTSAEDIARTRSCGVSYLAEDYFEDYLTEDAAKPAVLRLIKSARRLVADA